MSEKETKEPSLTTTEHLDLDRNSKYELVMIAAREARRLNDKARASGKEIRRRVTEVAWERLTTGKIHYTYGELPFEEEPSLPPLRLHRIRCRPHPPIRHRLGPAGLARLVAVRDRSTSSSIRSM